MVEERRKEQRSKSLLGGKVIFGRRQSVMDCTVKNIAPHGALVVFPHTALVPSEFMLHIPHREETFTARLAWRKHDRAGVKLSGTEAGVPIDQMQRIRKLEVENRRLRKQVDPGAW
jgi:hypothetical protein